MDNSLASEIWNRFTDLKPTHNAFVRMATLCDRFTLGEQWEKEDLMKLGNRPALTINRILALIKTHVGEQILARNDTVFKPRGNGANDSTAVALTKLLMQIGDNNNIPWVRTDVFLDGLVTGRGYFDVRLDETDSLTGEVRIKRLNPKAVMPDYDAEEADPATWSDVMTATWMSPNQIAVSYDESVAQQLRFTASSMYTSGLDEEMRDRFGGYHTRLARVTNGDFAQLANTSRDIRVLDYQWRKPHMTEHFVNIQTGDMRAIPADWDRERISQYLQSSDLIAVTKKLINRIRWSVVAGDYVLHDEWSPYRNFTVVPFFPFFLRGSTVGAVEPLISPQELLNKLTSQELHVINSTANGGWKLKRNALVNMSVAELEQRGAETGLVMELDDIANAEKIAPNQIPTGIERLSTKAMEYMKSVSNISDYMTGDPREDVSAKSVGINVQRGSVNMASTLDSLTRSDHFLAKAILDIVQAYYTSERIVQVASRLPGVPDETLVVNQEQEDGSILNDLTVGEYRVVVSAQPDRATFEETQFEQVVSMRKDLGVALDDETVIGASTLPNKADILAKMKASKESPEAQAKAALDARMAEATVAKLEGEAKRMATDADLRGAKAQKEVVETQKSMAEDQAGPMAELELKRQEMEMEMALKRQEMEMTLALKREQMEAELAMKAEESRMKADQARIDSVTKAATAATAKPTQPKK